MVFILIILSLLILGYYFYTCTGEQINKKNKFIDEKVKEDNERHDPIAIDEESHSNLSIKFNSMYTLNTQNTNTNSIISIPGADNETNFYKTI